MDTSVHTSEEIENVLLAHYCRKPRHHHHNGERPRHAAAASISLRGSDGATGSDNRLKKDLVMTPVCPKCESVMVDSEESDLHWTCPACGFYLSAWAYRFQTTTPIEHIAVQSEDEGIEAYGIGSI